eukprot:1349098-Amorphochlora_amoeboformis.AAC.3
MSFEQATAICCGFSHEEIMSYVSEMAHWYRTPNGGFGKLEAEMRKRFYGIFQHMLLRWGWGEKGGGEGKRNTWEKEKRGDEERGTGSRGREEGASGGWRRGIDILPEDAMEKISGRLTISILPLDPRNM